jgi:predicted ATPase/DNA-binding winged helix-turn-helix (wHTH) protein
LDLSQKDMPMLDTYRFGRFEVRPRERQLLVGDEPAPLGARAFDVLMALIERRERVVAKNELLDLVWPGLVVEENNLQVQVSSLRKLVGPQAIATIPGRGYRFTAALDVPAAERPVMPVLRSVRDAPASGASLPKAHPAPIGNLPAAAPRLIGRDEELHALTTLLHAHRLVTLVGAAGMGKTVLALAGARAMRDRFPDGVFVVELAPLADPVLVPGAVAQALGVTHGGDASARDQLLRALAAQSLLLVLDNCEHVVEAAGQLADELVARASGVRVLATSQEFMNVAAEKVFKVDPLGVPRAGETARRESHAAVALFVERAQAVDPRFVLNAQNDDAVADICRRLDGVPLAIELAAARVRLLGAQDVRDKLGERFRLLTGGARSALPRHQTLRAAIDWSHGLLSADERAVFRRLGVFVGGFTLELAQRVALDGDRDEWTVLDALGTLVDKSLVVAGDADPPRYRLLETTRAYALEQLAACDETAAFVRRHAEAMRDLFVATEDARFGEHGTLTSAEYVRALTPEIDNLRAALDWAIESEPRIGIALAGAGMELLRMLGHSQEAMRAMLALRSHADDEVEPRDAARFWRRLGCLGSKGAFDAAGAIEAQRRAVRICRDLGLPRGLFLSLYFLGWRLSETGDTTGARALLPELAALEDRACPAKSSRCACARTTCARS